MESMIEKNLFKPIEVYDYQALCKVEEADGNFASILKSVSKEFTGYFNISILNYFQPLNLLIAWIHWIITEFIISISKIQMLATAIPCKFSKIFERY